MVLQFFAIGAVDDPDSSCRFAKVEIVLVAQKGPDAELDSPEEGYLESLPVVVVRPEDDNVDGKGRHL